MSGFRVGVSTQTIPSSGLIHYKFYSEDGTKSSSFNQLFI
jgi:hypothetical protein